MKSPIPQASEGQRRLGRPSAPQGRLPGCDGGAGGAKQAKAPAAPRAALRLGFRKIWDEGLLWNLVGSSGHSGVSDHSTPLHQSASRFAHHGSGLCSVASLSSPKAGRCRTCGAGGYRNRVVSGKSPSSGLPRGAVASGRGIAERKTGREACCPWYWPESTTAPPARQSVSVAQGKAVTTWLNRTPTRHGCWGLLGAPGLVFGLRGWGPGPGALLAARGAGTFRVQFVLAWALLAGGRNGQSRRPTRRAGRRQHPSRSGGPHSR